MGKAFWISNAKAEDQLMLRLGHYTIHAWTLAGSHHHQTVHKPYKIIWSNGEIRDFVVALTFSD